MKKVTISLKLLKNSELFKEIAKDTVIPSIPARGDFIRLDPRLGHLTIKNVIYQENGRVILNIKDSIQCEEDCGGQLDQLKKEGWYLLENKERAGA